MTPTAALALFLAMLLLAALPSTSVLTVVARAGTLGLRHGAMAALGVVAGDCVFILVAILGLGLLVDALGAWFWLVKIVAAAYLCWLAWGLWRTAGSARPVAAGGGLSSFMAGLSVTLADHKAILFYLGFFPAFVDVSALGVADVLWVMLIALVAVGGVKLAYAVAAARAGALFEGRLARGLGRVVAVVLVGVALALLAGALDGLMEGLQ